MFDFRLPIPLDLSQLIKDRDYEGMKALVISKAPLIIAALAIMIIGFMIANFIGKLLVKALEVKGVDKSVHHFIRTIVVLLLKTGIVLSALSTINVDVNSFVAALAAGGVTAGFGLSASIGQIASGFQILINHPFKSGDFIDIGTVSGTVVEIKMAYTVLLTLDNRRVIVPNSTITTSNIINYNAENKRRMDLVYSISYDEDISKAREAILSVARAGELILQNPEPAVYVKEHAQSSINLVAFAWCDSGNYWPAFFYMQEKVKNEFDNRGITIPFNQLDVHIDNN